MRDRLVFFPSSPSHQASLKSRAQNRLVVIRSAPFREGHGSARADVLDASFQRNIVGPARDLRPGKRTSRIDVNWPSRIVALDIAEILTLPKDVVVDDNAPNHVV